MQDRQTMVGTCRRHGIDLKLEDGNPFCILCRKEEALREAKPAPAVVAVDPGHEVMVNWRTITPGAPTQAAAPQPPLPRPAAPPQGLRNGVEQAVSILRMAAMPANLKHFKAIQRAIKALESTLQPEEA